MNKRIKKKQIKTNNKKLCKHYPFLIPRNRWTDKPIWNKKNKNMRSYNAPYAYTELDAMPLGWREVFGEQMCEEIKNELVKYNYLDEYRITEIKEKYGQLRWYDFGVPKDSKIYDIVNKYTKMSEHICLRCGRPAEIINNQGWLEPVCDLCLQKERENTKKLAEKYKKQREEIRKNNV